MVPATMITKFSKFGRDILSRDFSDSERSGSFEPRYCLSLMLTPTKRKLSRAETGSGGGHRFKTTKVPVIRIPNCIPPL
jgi:hypothetical protein